MTLYLLTNGIGDWYVVASDATSAEKELTRILDKDNYGFYSKRKVTNIRVLADEMVRPDGECVFAQGNNLIIEGAYDESNLGKKGKWDTFSKI